MALSFSLRASHVQLASEWQIRVAITPGKRFANFNCRLKASIHVVSRILGSDD